MIERYSLPEMAAIWSERHKVDTWHQVEAAVADAWVAEGVVPERAAAAIRRAAPIDIDEWKTREEITHHDLAAFVDVLAASAGEGGEWVHYGLTSSDVLDTAQGLLLKQASALLLDKTAALFEVVKRRALEHRATVMIGRTHGMWAEPTSFGLKLAGWAFEVARDRRRLADAAAGVACGKISGAVGTYAHVPPRIEQFVCERLGLDIEPASTQVVARDRHAAFLVTLGLIGATLERFAVEIRHLQRSEIAEVSEPFRKGQKGSSSMPHKRNPVLSENITGIARLLRGWALASLENVALWHERDISHSSVERVVLPDACIVLDFALDRMARLLDGLVVYPDRMAANLEAAQGLVFSQTVLNLLIGSGMSRDEAYRLIQEASTRAWEGNVHLSEVLASEKEIPLDPETLQGAFDAARLLEPAAVVFERLEALTLD
jgi:adenylosuccinate lyase